MTSVLQIATHTLNLVRGNRSVSAPLREVPLPHPHQLRSTQTGRCLPPALQLCQALRSSCDPAGTIFNVSLVLVLPIEISLSIHSIKIGNQKYRWNNGYFTEFIEKSLSTSEWASPRQDNHGRRVPQEDLHGAPLQRPGGQGAHVAHARRHLRHHTWAEAGTIRIQEIAYLAYTTC